MDAAAESALNTAVDAIKTVTKIGTTIVVRAADSTDVTYWRDNTRREVEMEEVAIALVQALGEFYRRNRKAIDLIIKAYMLYVFLHFVFQLALFLFQLVLFLIQLAFSFLLTLCILTVLYNLPVSSHMDLFFS